MWGNWEEGSTAGGWEEDVARKGGSNGEVVGGRDEEALVAEVVEVVVAVFPTEGSRDEGKVTT